MAAAMQTDQSNHPANVALTRLLQNPNIDKIIAVLFPELKILGELKDFLKAYNDHLLTDDANNLLWKKIHNVSDVEYLIILKETHDQFVCKGTPLNTIFTKCADEILRLRFILANLQLQLGDFQLKQAFAKILANIDGEDPSVALTSTMSVEEIITLTGWLPGEKGTAKETVDMLSADSAITSGAAARAVVGEISVEDVKEWGERAEDVVVAHKCIQELITFVDQPVEEVEDVGSIAVSAATSPIDGEAMVLSDGDDTSTAVSDDASSVVSEAIGTSDDGDESGRETPEQIAECEQVAAARSPRRRMHRVKTRAARFGAGSISPIRLFAAAGQKRRPGQGVDVGEVKDGDDVWLVGGAKRPRG